ncbi:TonB-dependent receptor domain-containing protein [Belliella kenyensis]|uniref:TonB-dependent receptor domain-containing protein n=1 Tax=Belliella kenyensis TaxID=1472724 RepID=A0ABV8EI92_9BACT|nr:TonB-dependent receptor [Belliella kenyensis]MCH7400910.1 TonB-dependent receptor [Belliella kenyensis]MDN3603909.1 TonB-dependent receptor [Belliella kenyensis]
MKKIYLVILLTIVTATISVAQRVTISGSIRDASSNEALIGANVYDRVSQKGAVSNQFGFYSYTTTLDSVNLYFSYVGYQSQRLTISVSQDTTINVQLMPDGLLEEVVVSAENMDPIQEVTRMGTINIPIRQIKELPALMGEVDVFKVLQLLPGVQSGTEGASGLYVRGGGPDQNLILLDGVPIYNASHLFGFFSVFNADAINNVELIKGGFPSRYGGRLSSVIDVTMKEGNMKEFKGEGSIGLIASKITLEGPIVKDKTSFIISARRTYLDILARPIIAAATSGNETVGYYFYDLNGKVNHIVNDKNRIYLSVYSGDDKAYARYKNFYVNNDIRSDYEDEFGLKWGNFITALRWNNVINSRLFANYTFTYSRYHFDLFNDYQEKQTGPGVNETRFYSEKYFSGIRDWASKADFEFIPNPDHYIRFGGNVILHKFSPGVYASKSNQREGNQTLGSDELNSTEYSLYAEDDFNITSRLKANVGMHYSGFLTSGQNYNSLQPRVTARYLINESTSIKGSYVTMAQFIHLLTNAGLGLPTDLWVPATQQIGPQKAQQAALGFFKSLKGIELSAEAYYKTMDGLIEYRDGATYLNIDQDWQQKVAVGEGKSYGLELLAQKKIGKVSGWIGYTWSNTTRRFDEINFGEWFPYKYDRRHDISIALTHDWKDNKDFSLVWVYGTGNAVSLPTHRYEGAESSMWGGGWRPEIQYYESRNNFRNRAYHRLDLSFSWWKDTRWGQRKWTLGIYNAYNRLNPFFMDLSYDRSGNRKIVQYSLFPVIPSFAYTFKF